MANLGSSAQCEACRFFDDHKVNGGRAQDDSGLCRFNPPVTQPNPQGHGLWPVVSSHDWCGHFSPTNVNAAE
jgi:hypothetical protein